MTCGAACAVFVQGNGADANEKKSSRQLITGGKMRTWSRIALLLCAFYTEAIGRPNLGDVLPNFTQNDTQMRITTNRAGLLPQRSKNYDVSVEYYTKSAGEWTAGWFRRDVSDYLFSALT
jgi:outer membrane receptor protein involved in Fe transport